MRDENQHVIPHHPTVDPITLKGDPASLLTALMDVMAAVFAVGFETEFVVREEGERVLLD